MFPELFELPFVHVTVKSYGTMMVIGFLLALLLMRRLLSREGQSPEHITSVALYALITGVIGARIFYVVHYYDQFRGDFLSVFAVWNGGLEYLGGVMAGIVIILIYLWSHKLPVRCYLDVLSIGLMLGLSLGRLGCFLNGCCFGKPTNCPIAVCFPYGSLAYQSHVYPDQARGRDRPLLDLPAEYFGFPSRDSDQWVTAEQEEKFLAYLRPRDQLTEQQLYEVSHGKYRALPIHPTQLYSSVNALLLCGVLLLFRKKIGWKRPGATFSLMFILYGATRFVLEGIRSDNPFEKDLWWAIYKSGTISQNIGTYMVILGVVLFVAFMRMGDNAPR